MQTRSKNFNSTLIGMLLTAAPLVVTASGYGYGSAVVTNADDSGPGSLRHALEVEQAGNIMIHKSVGDININSTLEYTGTHQLTIRGHGQTVSTDINTTLLAVTNGASLSVSNLNFTGPGNFSISNRGDLGQTAGKGIFVDVRDDQTGVLNVNLDRVTVSHVAAHGVHISDCSLADDCGAGGGGGGDGSDASIRVTLNKVTIDDAGNGRFDSDGFRVDDRGDGDIIFFAKNSTFINIGADGVELDEGDDGDVFAHVKNSQFVDNGGYCDPNLLEAFLPAVDEAEFAESDQVSEADIPGAITGSPDDGCFEREVETYASGYVEVYEFGIDLDDGFDIDEAGDGTLYATIKGSNIEGNLDEGLDFDEEDNGSIELRVIGTSASGNTDDGYKLSELGEGDVIAQVKKSSANDNGGKGFVFEEEDGGDLDVTVKRSQTANNDDSVNTGIEAVQTAEGVGTLKVRSSDIADGIDTDGVDQI